MNTFFFSDLTDRKDRRPYEPYIAAWIRKPDRGSKFEHKMRFIKWLPNWVLMILMRRDGYDALFVMLEESLVGHLFFQKHADDWRMFSLFVREDCRGRGFARHLVAHFLSSAREAGKKGARLAAGGDEKVSGIYRQIVSGAIELPFPVRPGDSAGLVLFEG